MILQVDSDNQQPKSTDYSLANYPLHMKMKAKISLTRISQHLTLYKMFSNVTLFIYPTALFNIYNSLKPISEMGKLSPRTVKELDHSH